MGLGPTDSKLLPVLWDNLAGALPPEEIQDVFSNLRGEFLAEGDTPAPQAVKEMHGRSLKCRLCPKMKPQVNLPLWNVQNPDVILVTESPIGWSKDGSSILVNALQNAGFSSKYCMLTYLTRCYPTEHRHADDKEVSNCLPYLFSEVQLLQPSLVIALGLAAYKSVMGVNEVKLTEVRGELSWLGPWAVMPTYSPLYASKAGGRAAEDFQADLLRGHEFCYGNNN